MLSDQLLYSFAEEMTQQGQPVKILWVNGTDFSIVAVSISLTSRLPAWQHMPHHAASFQSNYCTTAESAVSSQVEEPIVSSVNLKLELPNHGRSNSLAHYFSAVVTPGRYSLAVHVQSVCLSLYF